MNLVGVGFYIVICIVLGVMGGLWLDARLESKPAFTIAGLVGGVVLAGYGVYQMLLPLYSKQNREKK